MQIRKLLVANRSEIAIRVMRAAAELGIRTVAIYAREDRFSLHRFKADESYVVGEGDKPIAAYQNIDDILRIARQCGADAIHPGYGFLSESPEFADACAEAGVAFIGPSANVMRTLGNKIAARNAAEAAGVPVMPASAALPDDMAQVREIAEGIGYPLMLKASWGGGGRGMRIVESSNDLESTVPVAKREAQSAFGNGEVYFEKLVQRARHIEVQLLGDQYGNLVHLYERDCSVQRRNQKVVERAPAAFLTEDQREQLCAAALKLGRAVGYTHAGTVEFLMDADTDAFYFIEVNPRVQVEHTVTEEITGIDIVKAQIRITEGQRIGDGICGVPEQAQITHDGFALQCRVTTEDPENDFRPDYGRLAVYRSASGFGVRLDGGTAYSGAVITPFYDSLLVKVTTWAPTNEETVQRMDRALREFRIRGLACNLQFLENVINHPTFQSGEATTRFIDQTPELFQFTKRRDRATKLLDFIGEVTVNGNPEMKGRAPLGERPPAPILPRTDLSVPPTPGTRERLQQLGPELREMDAGAATGAAHRHHDARRPPVALRHAHAQPGHARHRALLRAHVAADVFHGVLGRGDLRRRHALPARRSLAAPARTALGHAERAAADAAARFQRGRLHQLPGQRGQALRAAGRGQWHRLVPRLRRAQQRRQHARRHRRRARDRHALRSGHLLHGRYL